MAYRTQVISRGFPGAPGYNTFVTGADSTGSATTWYGFLVDLWTALRPVLANGTFAECDGIIEEFDPVTGQTLSLVQATPFSLQGTGAATKAVGGTCILLQWRTGQFRNGREVRGRSFISGIEDNADANGQFSGAKRTAVLAAVAAYASTDTGAIYSPTAGSVFQIASGGVWTNYALVRSRRD